MNNTLAVYKLLSAALIALLSACIFTARAGAYEFTGRIASDLYSYQGIDEDHLRPYLRFNGDMVAWRGPDGRTLRMHTSLRWTSDFADQLSTDPQLFVYDAYVEMNNVPSRMNLSLGRQFVYSGVGSALMDGMRLQYRPTGRVKLDLFGGSTVSSEDPETIQSLVEELAAGARVGVRPSATTSLSASWMLKRRNDSVSFHRVGLDADHYMGPAELFGRAAFNAANFRLAEILGRTSYRAKAWYLSGEYHYREPSVASNSIFSIIDFYAYKIGRVEARRTVWRQLWVRAQVTADFTPEDTSWRTNVGMGSPRYGLSWIHQTGYAGENDGVSGYLNVAVTDRLDCYTHANLFRYRVQLAQQERSDSYASSLGVRYRAGRGVTIRMEGQYLRNAVIKDDGRFFLQIAKSFAVRSDDGRKE